MTNTTINGRYRNGRYRVPLHFSTEKLKKQIFNSGIIDENKEKIKKKAGGITHFCYPASLTCVILLRFIYS